MANLPHAQDADVTVEEALGAAEVARILGVHPRTVERRREARKAPRPLEMQREEKLHRIWRELIELFSTESAIYWLTHPVPALEDRRPVDLMAEDGGLDRVLETVGRNELGHPSLMPDLRAYFRSAQVSEFSGTVYRICPARYAGNLVSMRGSFLHGARYNIRGYFGTLYTSVSPETARREMARYFTVAPQGSFVEAAIRLRLNRVVDLTNTRQLRKPGIERRQLIGTRYAVTQEIGLRAWENGIEALIVPSVARPAEHNLAVFLDNQSPLWEAALTGVRMVGD